MNPAYISAFAALAGALTSFTTSWITQRTQLRYAHREAESAELKKLYSDFIAEAARLYGDALTKETDDITGLVGLYAMVAHMRLVSDEAVIAAATRVEALIVETYRGPNRTLRELKDDILGGSLEFLTEFSAASRKDLAARMTGVR